MSRLCSLPVPVQRTPSRPARPFLVLLVLLVLPGVRVVGEKGGGGELLRIAHHDEPPAPGDGAPIDLGEDRDALDRVLVHRVAVEEVVLDEEAHPAELRQEAPQEPRLVHRAQGEAEFVERRLRLDDDRVARQFDDVAVGQRIAVALLGRRVDDLHQAAAGGAVLGAGKAHALQFGAEHAADDREAPRRQQRLVDVELVGIHRTLHHRLAQAVAGGDEDHVLEAGLGVDGEDDAGRAQVGAHHALHAGRQRHVAVREALVHAVADGTVVVQRGKYLFHLVQHLLNAMHCKCPRKKI